MINPYLTITTYGIVAIISAILGGFVVYPIAHRKGVINGKKECELVVNAKSAENELKMRKIASDIDMRIRKSI